MKSLVKLHVTVLSTVFLVAGVYCLPMSVYAQQQTSPSGTAGQLNAVLFILNSLSQDLLSGQVPLETIKKELDKLTLIVNAYVTAGGSQTAFDPPPGQVLGAFDQKPVFQAPPLPEAFISISPASGSNSVIAGGSSRTVLSFTIKAFYSDVEVRRVDVVFDKRMWLFAEEISLVAGGKTLSRLVQPMTPDSFFSLGTNLYAIRFTDFSETIREGRTKTLNIRVKAREFIPEEVDVRVFLNNRAVRIIDQVNIQHLVPGTMGGPDGSFSREFRVKR